MIEWMYVQTLLEPILYYNLWIYVWITELQLYSSLMKYLDGI
jgi:hypothetical protein